MLVHYFIVFEQLGRKSRPRWSPVGVWAVGAGPGVDFDYGYNSRVRGHESIARQATDEALRTEEFQPLSFLRDWQRRFGSSPLTMHGILQTTAAFASAAEVVQAKLVEVSPRKS